MRLNCRFFTYFHSCLRKHHYEIQKYKTGYYFLYVIEAEDNEATKEFDRIALINENVIRHLIVKVEER